MWTPGMTLDAIEREVIQDAMKFYEGNKTHTASALGIAIRTLDARLEKYAADAQARKEKMEASAFDQQRTFAEHHNSTEAGKVVPVAPHVSTVKPTERHPEMTKQGAKDARDRSRTNHR